MEQRRSQDAPAAVIAFAERYGTHDVESVLSLANVLIKKAEAISHESPAELRLRTAGKHKQKAEELAKDGEHDGAAAHLIRALLRPGLQEDMIEQLKRQFATAIDKLRQQREQEAVEAAEAAAAEARRVEEALALQEARKRAARDEADWAAFMGKAGSNETEADAAAKEEPKELMRVPINVNRGGEESEHHPRERVE